MSYREYPPDPTLANSIKCIWVLERDFYPLHGVLDLLPDSYIEVIFNFGGICRISDGHSSWELPPCYAVSLFERPYRFHAQEILKTIGIRFFAWGFTPLVGRLLDPAQVFHPLSLPWHMLMRDLFARPETFVLDRIQAHLMSLVQTAKTDEEVQNTSKRLFESSGRVRIDALASQSHVSRRHLERKFKQAVGMSPKMLARQIRFEQTRDHLSQKPDVSLSQLARQYGYTDQAHLSREFKSFTDRTPRQFIREIDGMREDMRYGVAFPAGEKALQETHVIPETMIPPIASSMLPNRL